MFFSKWRVWMTKKSMTNQKGRHQNGGRSGITSAALRHFRPSLEPLEDRTLLSAFLVKDINTDTVSSNPSNLTSVNGTLFFTADDNAHQLGLWKSDGTAAGTTLVKEIFPDSIISDLYNFTNVGGTLFFATRDQSSQVSELWKSDGTPAGTGVVKSFGTGFIASPNGRPAAFMKAGSCSLVSRPPARRIRIMKNSSSNSCGSAAAVRPPGTPGRRWV